MPSATRPDQLLRATISPLLCDPPPLPGWTERTWRAALHRPNTVGAVRSLLSDRRLVPLLAWVACRTRPERHLPAMAAVLAALGAALAEGERETLVVARQIEGAVAAARPLGTGHYGQVRMSASAYMERHAAPPSSTMPAADSPFLPTVANLLGLAGFDLADDSAFAGRLVVVLDVVLGHWMANARPGSGLPEFAPEDRLRSDKRLAVRLGADRDLLYLVYGPQPGRGRPLQEARRRGLAYWVARSWGAERRGEPAPAPPAPVFAHWRQELYRLDAVGRSSFAVGTR